MNLPRWLKIIAMIGLVLALLVGIVASQGAKLFLEFPVLLKIVSRLRDPIGPHQTVVWEAGPDRASATASERRPNIVVILVDDLGWNDLSWNGGGVAGGAVPTPNIDSLARDGVEFTMGYAGNATCAPSRAALMTGRYPQRFGFESTPAPPAMGRLSAEMSNEGLPEGAPRTIFHEEWLSQVPPMREQGVPGEEITIAELLRGGGYRTLMLGKWHLGDTEGKRPSDQGFDQFLGFNSGGSLFGLDEDPEIISAKNPDDPIDTIVWQLLPFAVQMNNGPRFEPDLYMTDYLSREAVRAIEANRDRPFFLYLAYNAPHNPLQAMKSDYDALAGIEDHTTRVYGAMLRSLDRGVGKVLDALRENGLEENTLVVFSSDNGGAHYIGVPGLNDPYRGWKMTFFEGGLHSPFFMKWPARLPAGRKDDTPVSHIDLFTTAAAAAGVTLPADRPIDGINLLPHARGEAQGAEREALFWRSHGLKVVLAEGWKLQVDERQDKRWLFDLASDPTERRDLADREPDRVASLQARLDRHDRELGPIAFPALVEGAIPIDRNGSEPRVPGEAFQYWPN